MLDFQDCALLFFFFFKLKIYFKNAQKNQRYVLYRYIYASHFNKILQFQATIKIKIITQVHFTQNIESSYYVIGC